MRRVLVPLLAAAPGLVVVLLALAGRVPMGRDIPGYFLPLRERTALVVAGHRGPFWDPDVGCGEPYFANPQTGVLYPLAWLALVLPAPNALGVEVGIHLAILGLGCVLLTRELGAPSWLQVAAAWGVVLAGPTADAAAVLNNLDTIAWAPWMWWAALRERTAALALFTALGVLAAEPQLAATAAVVAVVLRPTRRTAVGLALGVAAVAVQVVPFLFWVSAGDRGASWGATMAASGSVWLRELPSVLFAGLPLPVRTERYVVHLTMPLWAVVGALWGLVRSEGAVRRLGLCGAVLVALAVLAGVPGLSAAWADATGGMVRYPGRLLFLAAVALTCAASAALSRVMAPRVAAVLALVLVTVAVASRAPAVESGIALATAMGAAATPWAAPAALLGSTLLAPGFGEALQLGDGKTPTAMCLDAQRGAGRTYSVQPSWNQFLWIGGDLPARTASLGWGYQALCDGRRMVRTSAPLESRALAAHLGEADRGPQGRWWLDALAASRVISHHPIAGFEEVCRDGDFVVYRNSQAWPEVSVVGSLPLPGALPERAGRAEQIRQSDDAREWRVDVGAARGVLMVLDTPDRGWRFTVDGRSAPTVRGPGIIHGVAVPDGEHVVTMRYTPPGLLFGAAVSVIAVAALVGVGWRRS